MLYSGHPVKGTGERLLVCMLPMLHTSKLRGNSRNGFIRRVKALAASLALMILLPALASAYTVVLRNGRSMEIPADFIVTRAGITYEYAPGLYVTIQITSIDVAATERANSEPQGSLLVRARTKPRTALPSVSSSGSGTVARTLTDKELEAVRKRREASEAQYEQRRRELGLPSLEDTRRQREEELRRFNEQAARDDAYQAEAESYWRTRASELRTAIAVNQAALNSLYGRLNGETYADTLGSAFYFPSVLVWQGQGSLLSPFPGANGGPRVRPEREPIAGRTGQGPGVRPGRGTWNPGGSFRGFPRRPRVGAPISALQPFVGYVPYNSYYNRDILSTRIYELEAERAGLQARWRMLEEEARRAGVPPGWLRQ